VWERTWLTLDLGLQATTLIMRSESQLDALKELAQNFPRYSAALARKVTVDTHIASEVGRNINYGGKVPKGVWLNGRALKENELSAFG
jgi:UDP-glucose:glycoprotein glucosyltransferase